MPKDGSFKRAVRRHARETGKSYTAALAALEGGAVEARVRRWTKWRRAHDLPMHLEHRYGIRVESLTRLSPHGVGVFRVNRRDGRHWVARIFPEGTRSAELLRGDVDILRFLEKQDFPAERCAHTESLTTFRDQQVLVTEYVPGVPAAITPENEHAIAESLGRLHTFPPGVGGLTREGGAWGHDPAHAGAPREDLGAALGFLDAVREQISVELRKPFDSLQEAIATADGCDGLPEALTTPHVGGRNVVANTERGFVFLDWKPSGRGQRLAALATLLQAAIPATSGGEGPPNLGIVDAIINGYTRYVRLEPNELSRLKAVMRVHPLYFAAWRYWREVTTGRAPPDGSESWWPNTDLTDAVAEHVLNALGRKENRP